MRRMLGFGNFSKHIRTCGQSCPFIVKAGAPAEVVVVFAKEHQMDLIVMGRRAWAEDSPPMWRTAYAIVTQAACPVLSMKSAAALDPVLLGERVA